MTVGRKEKHWKKNTVRQKLLKEADDPSQTLHGDVMFPPAGLLLVEAWNPDNLSSAIKRSRLRMRGRLRHSTEHMMSRSAFAASIMRPSL